MKDQASANQPRSPKRSTTRRYRNASKLMHKDCKIAVYAVATNKLVFKDANGEIQYKNLYGKVRMPMPSWSDLQFSHPVKGKDGSVFYPGFRLDRSNFKFFLCDRILDASKFFQAGMVDRERYLEGVQAVRKAINTKGVRKPMPALSEAIDTPRIWVDGEGTLHVSIGGVTVKLEESGGKVFIDGVKHHVDKSRLAMFIGENRCEDFFEAENPCEKIAGMGRVNLPKVVSFKQLTVEQRDAIVRGEALAPSRKELAEMSTTGEVAGARVIFDEEKVRKGFAKCFQDARLAGVAINTAKDLCAYVSSQWDRVNFVFAGSGLNTGALSTAQRAFRHNITQHTQGRVVDLGPIFRDDVAYILAYDGRSFSIREKEDWD